MSERPDRSDRLGRQVRRALVAFPWRDRVERGDEITSTVRDGLPPEVDRLPLATAVDLVRGGLRIRRQRRPPLVVRMAYRQGHRVDPRWVPWVFDDLEDPHHVRKGVARRLLAIAAPSVVVLALLSGVVPWFASLYVAAVIGVLACATTVVTIGGVRRERADARRRHGLAPGGRDPDLVWVRRSPHGSDGALVAVVVAGLLALVLLAAGVLLVLHGEDPLSAAVALGWPLLGCTKWAVTAWMSRRPPRPGGAHRSEVPVADLDVIGAHWGAGFELVPPPAGLPVAGASDDASVARD